MDKTGKQRRTLALGVSVALAGGGVLLDSGGARETAIVAMYVTAILCTLFARGSSVSLFVAAGCMVLMLGGLYFTMPAEPALREVASRLLAVYALGVTGALLALYQRLLVQRARIIEERESALDHVKNLQGLIPICSSCQKVRTEEGAWEKLEAYIRQHFDARFSHSLCPECAERLYPGFAKRMLQEKQPASRPAQSTPAERERTRLEP